MSEFKLLAVRPLKGCDKRFLKNLKKDQIYKLYNDFSFVLNKKNEVIEITDESTLPINLFGDNINVSAIVGKNGSGKSALIELFVACVNQLSYYLNDTVLLGKKQIVTDAELESIEFSKGSKGINAEIFFQKENYFYMLKINDNKFHTLYNISEHAIIENNKLKEFFYTLIINYSIYSFNPHVLGKSLDFYNSSNHWIDGLFHKNDSYQIPIVINPKRESASNRHGGVIDVNNEQDLLQQRLLFNILKFYDNGYDEHLKITENRKAVTILKENKPYFNISLFNTKEENKLVMVSENVKDRDGFWKNSFKNPYNNCIQIKNYSKDKIPTVFWRYDQVLLKTLIKFKIVEKTNPYIGKCYEYIVYKIFSICEKYPDYQIFLNWKNNNSELIIDIDKFLVYINNFKNRSHITNKLMQVVNFIKFYDEVWHKYNSKKINILTLSKELHNLSIKEKLTLIELLPPPIFSIKIEVDEFLENKYQNNKITIDKLSSGEQQLIHSTSTILYHLNNIKSVRATRLISKYDCVNLIFDEIELYFHPEYQRKLLKNILESIKNNKLDTLKINILFVTHSPFVLSDIPNQNILKLEDGNMIESEDSENTFGANIHDMLANDFFLKNGFMGEFAKSEINQVINYLNIQKLENQNQILKSRLKDSTSKSEKKEIEETIKENNRTIVIDRILESKYDKKYCAKLIELIGEPMLSTSLMELYIEAYPSEKKNYIESQIKRLQNLKGNDSNPSK
ncbi:AAA family ATPase [Flavobacterium sp.]|uniref:AAA family ATPase n=1 Tax=Flavobacterium sp. TaxID=239 RepID=UPI003D6C0092